jgi:tetratricopeptide (TPR) repeat protein
VSVDLLDTDEAGELLRRRIGPARAAAEPEMVQTIAAECARLPLALAVVAARAAARPDLPLAVLAAQLDDSALGTLTAGDPRTTVQTVFSWSYRALTAEGARLFRLLGLHPGPDVTAPAAASLAGIPAGEVEPLLSELGNAHLMTEHSPGRWTFHDLLRAYVRELVDPAREHAALRRMFDHYLHVANAAAMSLNPQRDPITQVPPADGVVLDVPADAAAARQWFTAEHAVLRDLVPAAARAGLDTHAWQLARSMTTYVNQLGLWSEMADLHTIGLAAARRTGDRDGQVHTSRDLGLACVRRGDYEEAHMLFSAAVELCVELEDERKWVHAHHDLAELLGLQGRLREAIGHLELASTATAEEVNPGNTFAMLSWFYAQLGDYEQALRHCKEGLVLSEKAGDQWSVASTCDNLGYIYHQLGDYRQALSCYQRALDIVSDFGDLYRQAEALDHIADTYTATGDLSAAREAQRRAESIRRDFDRV